ncbi:MAG TPA: hypothetical protein VE861_04780, partial [Gemmatimonadaceae bacterium]|nr:hypothetical protein [Gemmatimonadaceae bacterium]
MRALRVTLTVAGTAACLAGRLVAQSGPSASIDTTPSRLVPARVATLDSKLSVPTGFTVTRFASVPNARAMVVAPDGSVYVSTPGKNSIVRLQDTDRDGTADSTNVVLTGLDRPHGMAFHKGKLYVANTGGVVRYAM